MMNDLLHDSRNLDSQAKRVLFLLDVNLQVVFSIHIECQPAR